jgi:hypothetical protein
MLENLQQVSGADLMIVVLECWSSNRGNSLKQFMFRAPFYVTWVRVTSGSGKFYLFWSKNMNI